MVPVPCAPSGHELNNKWIILVFYLIVFNYLCISFFVFKCHLLWKTVDVTSYQIQLSKNFFTSSFKQLRTPTTFHSLRDYATPELATKFKLLYYNLNKTFFKRHNFSVKFIFPMISHKIGLIFTNLRLSLFINHHYLKRGSNIFNFDKKY